MSVNNNCISKLTVDQKLAAKKAAFDMKFGSPKFRDVLRERCRSRIKESRKNVFNSSRDLSAVKQDIAQSILNDELKEFQFDVELQEIIFQEMLEEDNEWLFNTIEDELRILSDSYSEDKCCTFCPLCLKNELIKSNEEIMCHSCNISFTYNNSLNDLYELIKRKIDEHDQNCTESLKYFVEPNATSDQSTLNGICEMCDFYCKF